MTYNQLVKNLKQYKATMIGYKDIRIPTLDECHAYIAHARGTHAFTIDPGRTYAFIWHEMRCTITNNSKAGLRTFTLGEGKHLPLMRVRDYLPDWTPEYGPISWDEIIAYHHANPHIILGDIPR